MWLTEFHDEFLVPRNERIFRISLRMFKLNWRKEIQTKDNKLQYSNMTAWRRLSLSALQITKRVTCLLICRWMEILVLETSSLLKTRMASNLEVNFAQLFRAILSTSRSTMSLIPPKKSLLHECAFQIGGIFCCCWKSDNNVFFYLRNLWLQVLKQWLTMAKQHKGVHKDKSNLPMNKESKADWLI